MARRRKTYSLHDGRVYLHKKCREYTCVSEKDFEGICNPLTLCVGTWCNTCNNHDKLKNFYWADTKERLDKYRSRLRRDVPFGMKAFAFGVPLLGALLGLVAGLVLVDGELAAGLTCAGLVGGGLYMVVIPFLFRFVIRTKFYEVP